MTQYDISCLYTGTVFDTFQCLVAASNYVLLYVLLVVVFGAVLFVFSGSQLSTKNTLLLASTVTAVCSILLLIVIAAAGYGATAVSAYSSAALFCSVIAFAALLYHILSDL